MCAEKNKTIFWLQKNKHWPICVHFIWAEKLKQGIYIFMKKYLKIKANY